LYGSVNGRDQMIASQRFGEVGDGAVSQTLLAHGRLVVCGDDDDRQVNLCERQPPLQIATGQTGHLKIENDAVGQPAGQGIEKLLAAAIHRHFELTRQQHACQSPSDGFLIIDNSNDR